MTVDWVVLIVYVAVFVFVYRRAYLVFMAADAASDAKFGLPHDPDTETRAFCGMMGLVMAFCWPIVVPGYLVWRTITPSAPGERQAAIRRREQELADAEADLARRERELGIRRD